MAANEQRQVRILSIDGGGIRGIIPAMILQWIEEQTDRPVWQNFDLIAGTSTGGILALGLATATHESDGLRRPYTPAELAQLYIEHGGEIFRKPLLGVLCELWGPKYSPAALEKYLNQYFGSTQLRSALTPLLISSYDLRQQLPFFFKSHKIAAEPGYNWDVKQVARATSAAPTFFPPLRLTVRVAKASDKMASEEYVLVDGGVFANNPAMAAYAEARNLYPQATEFFVLSVGTGNRTDNITYKQARRWGLLGWAKRISTLFMDSVSEGTDYELASILGADYERLQPELVPNSVEMDDASEANIRRLQQQAESFIADNQTQLQQICARLTSY